MIFFVIILLINLTVDVPVLIRPRNDLNQQRNYPTWSSLSLLSLAHVVALTHVPVCRHQTDFGLEAIL